MANTQLLQASTILFFFLLFTHISKADPDPLQDFCVGNTQAAKNSPNRLTCRDPEEVTVEDFVYSGIRHPSNQTNSGVARTSVDVFQFAGLNTVGMALARVDFEPGAVNVPHLHPRATEIGYVVEGTLYSGFVTSENRLFAKIIEKGDVMVFPRGLVHFQMNVGDGPAVIVGSLNSQNPGIELLPFTLFGSGIRDDLLQKAFQLTKSELDSLKVKFGPKA
eukprot:Gb_00713 [translate_table: standard]